jgi:NTE family protein
MRLGLVLGGGGVTGIAWEIGLLCGLRDRGVDLAAADVVVGTSAGSVVGSLVATGQDLTTSFERQLAPYDAAIERRVDMDMTKFMGMLGSAGLEGVPQGEVPQPIRARIGKFAVEAPVDFTEEERIATMRSRLGAVDWPQRPLLVPAIACDDGEFRVFSREAGVPLATAVAASCAVPLVFPPITVEGRRYMDGGMRSVANADLALGCDRVVIVTPLGPASGMAVGLPAEVTQLRDRGAHVSVLEPDPESLVAIGPNVLDPERRSAAARAGQRQAVLAVDEVRAAVAR